MPSDGENGRKNLSALYPTTSQIRRNPKVVGSYVPTEKNHLMEKFYEECNFTLVNTNDENGETVWEFDLTNTIEEYPNWFEFVNQ